jgi:hypothetical protein
VSGFAVPKACLVSACGYSVGTEKKRNRTESPQVWRGGTRNPSLTITKAVGWKSIPLFFGVIRLAEWPLKWPFKPSARLPGFWVAFCGGFGEMCHSGTFPTGPAAARQRKRPPGREPGGRCGLVTGSGRGGLAADPGAGSGGQGDAELGQLHQVEPAFVIRAELVPSDGAPVGFCGQAPNTI